MAKHTLTDPEAREKAERRNIVSTYLSDSLKAETAAAAKRAKMSVAAFIRAALVRAMGDVRS